jgi:hypothetical protein
MLYKGTGAEKTKIGPETYHLWISAPGGLDRSPKSWLSARYRGLGERALLPQQLRVTAGQAVTITRKPRRVIHSSYYQVFSDGNSGDWIGEMLSTFPQPKMNIY